MKLESILIDNAYDCFTRHGDFEANEAIISKVADWLLTTYEYPHELWEDDQTARLIALACTSSTDFDKLADMARAVRANAKRHAESLINDQEDMIREVYYEEAMIREVYYG